MATEAAALDPGTLAQVIREIGISHKQNTKSYIFACPRCSGKDKLYIRKLDGKFCCWKCKETSQFQGKPEYALAELTGTPISSIKGRLYGDSDRVKVDLYLDVRIRDFFGDEDDVEGAQELPTIVWPSTYLPIEHQHCTRGAAYLEGRGVPLDVAKQYGIRYAPEERVVAFPVSSNGRLLGYQTRLIIPNEWTDANGVVQTAPKALTSKDFKKERTLMFGDRITGDHAVLCEGPIDAIKSNLCGGNVCAMGKAVSAEQVRLLLYSGIKRLYLALDPDAANEVERIARSCFGQVELYTMFAPQIDNKKNDLGAMTFEEVKKLFDGAKRITAGQVFVYFRPPIEVASGR